MLEEFEKRQEQIERYLNGSLSEEEKVAFEQQMVTNEELAEDVRLHQEINAHLQDNAWHKTSAAISAVNNDFFNKIEKLPSSNEDKSPTTAPSKRKWWLGGLAGILLLSGSFWLFTDWNNTTKNTNIVPTELPTPTKTIFEEEQNKENIKNIEDTPTTNTPLPKPSTTAPSTTTDKPIASANSKDFTTNPILEGFIKENLRSNSSELTITSPVSGAVFNKNGNKKIALKITGSSKNGTTYRIFIYDNKVSNFEKARPVLSRNLSVKNTFRFNALIELEEGLYYYYIIDANTEDIAGIGKFFVQE